MKSFVTEGTGSQQTLTNSQNNKIPVYATDADAEADLANLEVGQIIGITDTGDELAQPVDVVEENNLHAVTSNAVSESLSYSETEQKTGGKWIDGKPIYRMVTVATLNQQVDSSAYKDTGAPLPSNVDKYIRIISTQRTGNCFYYSTSSATLYITGIIQMNALAGTAYILEYTKTTD